MSTPEELARQNIDKQLQACGWTIQSRRDANLFAGCGVAIREFPLDTGEADYLLFVDGKAVGVIEAKPEGVTLSGVADQAANYSVGLPANIPHVSLPLPFIYESTGVETFFRDEQDPEPRLHACSSFSPRHTIHVNSATAQAFANIAFIKCRLGRTGRTKRSARYRIAVFASASAFCWQCARNQVMDESQGRLNACPVV